MNGLETVVQSPDVDYHSDTTHVSRSDLCLFAISRRRYKRAKDRAESSADEKGCFRIGTGTHALTLKDPWGLANLAEIPAGALKNGRRIGNAFTKFKHQHKGKTLLKSAEFETCMRLSDSLLKLSPATTPDGQPIRIADLVSSNMSRVECEHRWTDVLPCRLKADLILELHDAIICIDLKTARSISDRAFRTEVFSRKLWLQDAHYSAGLFDLFGKPVRFVFVAVEKTDPFDSEIFELDAETKELAAAARLKLLGELKECLETGVFVDPPKPIGIKSIRGTAEDLGIML